MLAGPFQKLWNQETPAPEFIDALDESTGKQALLWMLSVHQFLEKRDDRFATTFLMPPTWQEIQELERTGSTEPWRFALSAMMDKGTQRLAVYVHTL